MELQRATRNQIVNVHNRFQGNNKRVLFVCSAGMLRSATAAVIFTREPFNFNTRSAGLGDYALIPVTEVLLMWADEIVCMENHQLNSLKWLLKDCNLKHKNVKCLNIPDDFVYMNEQLQKYLIEAYNSLEDE